MHTYEKSVLTKEHYNSNNLGRNPIIRPEDGFSFIIIHMIKESIVILVDSRFFHILESLGTETLDIRLDLGQ